VEARAAAPSTEIDLLLSEILFRQGRWRELQALSRDAVAAGRAEELLRWWAGEPAAVSERPAELCLILEGTYPYVDRRGVVLDPPAGHRPPELRFAIFHISATQGEAHEPRYEMPPNVVSLIDVGIHGGDEPAVKGEVTEAAAWETIWLYHEEMKDGRADGLEGLLRQISPHAGAGPSVHDFIYGKPSWEIVRRLYESRAPDISFLDYFWTWRFTHLPMFRLLRAPVPDGRGLSHRVHRLGRVRGRGCSACGAAGRCC